METEYGDTLGQRLRYFRERAGLSQRQVALFLGVTREAIGGWERDVSDLAARRLIRLAQLYGVKPGVFFPPALTPQKVRAGVRARLSVPRNAQTLPP